MKHILYIVLALMLFTSCRDSKKAEQKVLLDSSGHINNVSVVMDNALWNGQVGDAIRNILAAPIYGLPQDEPLFTLSQIPPSVFSGFVTKSRAILIVGLDKSQSIKITDNVYAQPQKVITLLATNKAELITLLKANAEKIVNTFHNGELAERSRQMAKSPHNYTAIKEKLGLTLQFPSIYRIAKQTDDFFWLRKDITTGSTNILLYKLPLEKIAPNDSLVNQIISVRDSIGKMYIEGSLKNTYMVTENAYAPFIEETIIDNKPAFETKGIWDLKNGFMGGPFINYAIKDKTNNRWVVIEGFAFAPSVEKRDYMLELEAIIKSVKIDE